MFTLQLKTKKYETVTSTVIFWVSNAIKKARSKTEIMKELGNTLIGHFCPWLIQRLNFRYKIVSTKNLTILLFNKKGTQSKQ